jgi:hypothetical protein
MVEPPPVFSVRLANRANLAASIAAESRGSGKEVMARIISAVEDRFAWNASER